jgi:hypothetical protein
MSTNKKTKKADASQNRITEKGIAWIKENGWDGHTIWKPSGIPWSDLGLNGGDVKRLVNVHRSDRRDPKTTIFGKYGEIIDECNGVHNLPLLGAIADKLGVGGADGIFCGRGSRARALTNAILTALGQP